ncbi:MAG: exosortase/archaeosortase family protein [Nitrospira sp.]
MQIVAQLPNEEKGDQRLDGRSSVLVASSGNWLLGTPLPVTSAQRNVFALLLFLVTCIVFCKPLQALWDFALQEESFSHVMLIPVVTGYLLIANRVAILRSKEWSPVLGIMLILLGGLAYWFGGWQSGLQDWTLDRLAATIAALVLTWWGIFLVSFGWTCFRQNLFVFAFLLLMVPLPSLVLSAVVGFLQRNSAEAAAALFAVLDVPVFREGLIFHLSQLTIHVAEECSGIRSFLSLLITSLLAGHWFLRGGWAKAALVAFVVPLAIIKNAFRIVGLALLANYIDQTYITNSLLHRAGGIPLFVLSLFVLVGVVWALRKFERQVGTSTGVVKI